MIRFHKWITAGLIVVVLACVTGPILAAETKGTITIVRPERSEFVLSTGSFKDMTFQADNAANIVINGHAARLADLREGDRATVVYTRIGRLLIANMVRVDRKVIASMTD